MAGRKRRQSDYQESLEITDKVPAVEIEAKTEIKRCKIFNIVENKLFLYFDNYGLQVDVSDGVIYKIGDVVAVSYTGEIGKPDFKKWIAN